MEDQDEDGNMEAESEEVQEDDDLIATEVFVAERKAAMDRKLHEARKAVSEARTNRSGYWQQGRSSGKGGGSFGRFRQAQKSGSTSLQQSKGCFICGALDHRAAQCPKRYQQRQVHFAADNQNSQGQTAVGSMSPTGEPAASEEHGGFVDSFAVLAVEDG